MQKETSAAQKENPSVKTLNSQVHDDYPEPLWTDNEEYELIGKQVKAETLEQNWEKIEEDAKGEYHFTKIANHADIIDSSKVDKIAQLLSEEQPNKEDDGKSELIKNHVSASSNLWDSPIQQENESRNNPLTTRNELSDKSEEIEVEWVQEKQPDAEIFKRVVTMEDKWGLQDENKSWERGSSRDNVRWLGRGTSNVFIPEDTWTWRPALKYFFTMWVPRVVDLLDMLTDIIVMCSIQSSGARAMQGCFLFLPFVVLWGSRYNAQQFESWYLESLSKDNVETPKIAWLNTLPWTGVPTVFLQEFYFLLYMVCMFPLKFWGLQFKEPGKSYQLSCDIYDKDRVWYIQMLRLLFEDLPTIVLLFWVLLWTEHNVSFVIFSLLTSVLSSLRTLANLLDSSRNRGKPVHIVIFSTLLIPPSFAVLPHHDGL